MTDAVIRLFFPCALFPCACAVAKFANGDYVQRSRRITSSSLFINQYSIFIYQSMRLASSFHWLLSLLYVFSLSTILTAARPYVNQPNESVIGVSQSWGLDLGGGWTFYFSTDPSMFYPIDKAALGLNHLYELAMTTAQNPANTATYSAVTAFRVGEFGLVFNAQFSPDFDEYWKSRIYWPAIATFSAKMQDAVSRGETLYYEGIIVGPNAAGGKIIVELRLFGSS